MKNRHSTIMILITGVFVAFTLGFLTGRSTAPGDTIVAQMPPQTQPATLPPDTVPVTVADTVSVTVPATDSIAVSSTTAPPAKETSRLINVNTATLAQLDTLPGIGPVIAQRIIDYREKNGPFTAVSQLMSVEGIGEKRLAAIIDLITLE